jgi:hypothetical protein
MWHAFLRLFRGAAACRLLAPAMDFQKKFVASTWPCAVLKTPMFFRRHVQRAGRMQKAALWAGLQVALSD